MERAGRSGYAGIPKVLVEVYGDAVRTLRQLILQLLGPSLRLTPCKCHGQCDDLIQYCAKCDPSGFLLRDGDHADYWNLLECSYAVVSNPAPQPESFTLDQRWTQRQIIERAIALQFRQETRPHNVICFGYRQPQPNNADMGFTVASYDLESTSSNFVVRLLNSQAWMVLLSRVGDMFMLHLLSYTSIFYPFPNNSYLQVTGTPISSLVSSVWPDSSVQSRNLGPNHPCRHHVGTGVCRTSGFHALREYSFVTNQSQSKDLIHTSVPLICGSMGASVCDLKSGQEMDKTTALTESTCLFQRDCKGGQKRRIFTNNINSQYKQRKGGGTRKQCIPNKGIDSACAVSQCTDLWYGLRYHDQNDCARKTVQNKYDHGDCISQTAALDTPHFGQMLSEIISSDRGPKEYVERGPVCLPGPVRSRNNKRSESELVSGWNIHPELGEKTEIVGSCFRTETVPLESFHSPSCNAPTNGGRSKKRSRPFSWQRRRKRRFEERIFSSTECASHNWGLKDSTNKETSMSQQVESVFSPSHLDCSLGITSCSNQCGVALQGASSKSSVLPKNFKIATSESDKIFVLDQITSLRSETLLFSAQAQNCQKMTLFPQSKGNELSSLKARHQSSDGIVHRICCSLCCRDKGRKMVNGYQHICADDGHICYLGSSCLPTEHYHRYLMSGRKCIVASHIRGAKKVVTSEATTEMKSQDPYKMLQTFVPKESFGFKKLNSQFICNSSDQRRSQQNAKSMEQGMFLSNRTKMSFNCACWLMLHAKHRDPANTLINRRRLFYNNRFSHRAGFSLNHTLNMIKPSNSGAVHLLGLIFGLHDVNVCDLCSCHENFIGGAGTFESSCIIHSLLHSLKSLIRNAQHCNYARLLARHAPATMQSNEIISMKLSEVCKSPSKGLLSNLHETAGKDNNPVVAESASHAQARQRIICSSTGKKCSIHSGHINGAGAKFEPQSATITEFVDENFHQMGLFSKHSHWKRFVVNRKREDYFVSGIIGNKTGCDSNHSSKISNKGKTSGDCPSPSKNLENNLVNSYTSYKEVVSFIWAVCRRIVPETLLGAKCNWRALRSNIAKFVQLRRHETFSLQHCLYKLKISHFPWLNKTTLVGKYCMGLNNCNLRDKECRCLYGQLEDKKGWTDNDSRGKDKGGRNSCKMLLQQHMLASWIFWLFSSFIVPLIRAHFYVTESENGRQNVFYYQRTVWTKILNAALKELGRNNYKRLSAVSLASILQKRSLGYSQVRFLPRKSGVRPIANLGAPSTIQLWRRNNTLQAINHRRECKLANNLTIFERSNIRKCFNQNKSFEGNPGDSLYRVRSKHNQERRRGAKGVASQSGQRVSDDASNKRRHFGDSYSHVDLSFRSVNSLLCDSHYCLKLEQDHHPEDLGCSVFNYNDVYVQFLPFVLSLKGFSRGMPLLYMVVCDVAKAFDTINQDKLLGVIENTIRKEEYLIHRYTKVACRSKSVKVSYERASIPEEEGSSFTNFASVLSAKHSQCIFVDQAFITRLNRQQLLALMREHVKRNVLQIGPHFYIQKVGIPQGSVLSSLLCSFYYGHLDKNIILPLLKQDRKQDVTGSLKATYGDYEFHGVDRHSSCSRTLLEAQKGWKITTNLYKEVRKIYGSFARNSGRTGIVQEGLDIASCTNGEDSEGSCNVLVQCSSGQLDEYETRNCKFVPSKSLLLRLIDDSLFISTSKREALCFVAKMHKGFKEYNCFANEHKTALSFDMELQGKNMEKSVYRSKDGACFMRWNGLLINCHTLEIQADYTRYWGVHISSTLTVWRQRNPGYNLVVKLCQFMRPKCHPIFYDSNINSPATIRLNAYQAFLLCAMKFHAYVCSMPSVGGCSAIYLLQAIMKSTRYMHQLVKQRIYHMGLKSSVKPIFVLQQKEMEWLGLYAYNKVLQRKQSRYKELLSFLVAKLHRSKYKDLAWSPDLKFAVDDDCSSMFWQIQY